MSLDKFKTDYRKAAENPPKEGDVLRAVGGVIARLTLELSEGKPPFIYGRAHVPNICGEPVDGWALQHLDTKSNYGWKCVLLPKAREEVLRRFPDMPDIIPVIALRVVRVSRSGKALLCEVAEWVPAGLTALEPEAVAV